MVLDAMVFDQWFWTRRFSVHGFGCDGFRSMVLDAPTCINMYCNIERNIMKNQSGSPVLGSRGKSFYICVYVLCSPIVYFLCFRIHMQVIFVHG